MTNAEENKKDFAKFLNEKKEDLDKKRRSGERYLPIVGPYKVRRDLENFKKLVIKNTDARGKVVMNFNKSSAVDRLFAIVDDNNFSEIVIKKEKERPIFLKVDNLRYSKLEHLLM